MNKVSLFGLGLLTGPNVAIERNHGVSEDGFE